MELSVLVPTHDRATKLAQCLRALAAQDLDQTNFEVLVGLDGPDERSALMAADVWSDERHESLRIVECPRGGANATRNRLLERARGQYVVMVNDDVIPGPDFLSVHLREQQVADSPGAMIAGYSPWRLFDNDMLFDVLVRETSMIFFYDQMFEAEALNATGGGDSAPPRARHERGHDWGFRHWWTLNASAPLEMLRAVNGFLEVPLGYGYDDIELAFRLHERFAMPVLFRPEAIAVHDHRYQPAEVLERERRLGEAAWHYARLNPAFAQAVFGRNVQSSEELAYSREYIHREATLVDRLEPSFVQLAEIPASVVEGRYRADLIRLLYQQHLALKRWHWRRGLINAAGSRGQDASD